MHGSQSRYRHGFLYESIIGFFELTRIFYAMPVQYGCVSAAHSPDILYRNRFKQAVDVPYRCKIQNALQGCILFSDFVRDLGKRLGGCDADGDRYAGMLPDR
jgi:hypothetical protein